MQDQYLLQNKPDHWTAVRLIVLTALTLFLGSMLAACGESTPTFPATTDLATTSAPLTTSAPAITGAVASTQAATTAVPSTVINSLATVTPMPTTAPVTTAAPTSAPPPTTVAPTTTAPTTAPSTTTAAPTTEAAGKQTGLQVFFSNIARAENEVFGVSRTTSRPDVATYIVEQYILGPTDQEKAQGFTTEVSFSTPSNCGGKDFTLTITNSIGNLKFCRSVPTAGVLQDARLTKALAANLKQFPSVSNITILDDKGNCFKDLSGLNNCLAPATGQTAGEAEKIIADRSRQTMLAIKQQDMVKLAAIVHPDKGVRFSAYSFVSNKDQVFTAAQVKALPTDKKVYTWGISAGRGEPINLTWANYYKRYVYRYDFVNAKQVSYNQTLRTGNTTNNSKDFYPGSIIVEHYFPGFDPKAEGLDWSTLRLIFEKQGDSWYLSGVINDEWTI